MEWLTTFAAEFGGITQLTASALLALVVVMILRGQIVPKVRLDEARQDRDAWRQAYEAEHQRAAEYEKSTAEQIRSLDLVQRALDAMTPPRDGGDRGAQGSVPSP
jgi:hypothetical protein